MPSLILTAIAYFLCNTSLYRIQAVCRFCQMHHILRSCLMMREISVTNRPFWVHSLIKDILSKCLSYDNRFRINCFYNRRKNKVKLLSICHINYKLFVFVSYSEEFIEICTENLWTDHVIFFLLEARYPHSQKHETNP